MTSDAFLDGFMETNDEVKKRMLCLSDFGQELGNEENDVPLYDQYNRGLALTQQSRPRINLSIDPTEQRCGLTGYIPSMEQGMMMGAQPKPKTIMMDLGQLK
jgi:hypothetical protein